MKSITHIAKHTHIHTHTRTNTHTHTHTQIHTHAYIQHIPSSAGLSKRFYDRFEVVYPN